MRPSPFSSCVLAFLCYLALCDVPCGALSSIQDLGGDRSIGAENSAKCEVSGQVIHAKTREPIKRAQIDLFSASKGEVRYRAFTDSTGRFAIENIPPGQYYLAISRYGYVTQSYGQDSFGSSGAVLALVEGRKITDLIFRMTPWGVISGRVFDDEGQPFPDVEVVAMESRPSNGTRKLFRTQYCQTNDRGEYRLYGLRKGRYYIRVEYTDRQKNEHPIVTNNTAFPPTYYPGTPIPSRATPVEVLSGEEVPGVDVAMVPTRAVRVRGTVYNAIIGKPAESCCVFLEFRDLSVAGDPLDRPGHTLGPNGTFEIDNVVAGSFTLVASSFIAGKVHYARLPIEVGGKDLEDVRLSILPGVELRGNLISEGRPFVDRSAIQVQLESLDSDPSMISPAKVGADGSFRFADVPLGTYEVTISGGPPNLYLKGIKAKGEQILNGRLEVTSDTHESLEIVIAYAGGIDGTVSDKDGLPVAGALVVAIPDDERRDQYRLFKHVRTDQYGRFAIPGIAPGGYELFAWKGIEIGDWEDPTFVASFEQKATLINVDEDRHSSISLTLILTNN
jgi:hypothetical protein